MQCYIRKSSYLRKPKTDREHTSIDGSKILSNDLINFFNIAKANTINFINAEVKSESIKLMPVYVTMKEEQEGNRMENKIITENEVCIFKKCPYSLSKSKNYKRKFI